MVTDDVEGLADVAVGIEAPSGEHVGIVFRNEDGEARLLHLAFHHHLRNNDVPLEFCWIIGTLPIERQVAVASMCERVWKRVGRNIPYGFRYDATTFRTDGELHLGPQEHGLTCATFVLAVFRSVGVELLAWKQWPPRDEDVARFMHLVDLLDEHCADKAHIAAVKKETGAVRYRPSEVAAASSRVAPCSFSDAVAGSGAILSWFESTSAAGVSLDEP